jgi:low molecular weight protein-tyrosine phosphatase
MLFNSMASRSGLEWIADSRGLEISIYNAGPIYPSVLRKLRLLGIPVEPTLRSPMQLEATDLEQADLVVALDAAEHRPLMSRRFAAWVDRIVYWNVSDLHLREAEEALGQIERNVTALVQELCKQAILPGKVEPS